MQVQTQPPPELCEIYGPGFIMVGSLDKVIPEEMTVHTSWTVPKDLKLHLAGHFPPPNKPIYPGVIHIQRIAESTGLPGFRIAEIEDTLFKGPIGPGGGMVAWTVERVEPEFPVEPITYKVQGQTTNSVKLTCWANLRLETVDTPTTFLSPLDEPSPASFPYTGEEILVPRGPNLDNSLLVEHAGQSSILLNARLPQFKGKQFWLLGIQEARFYSDVPWGATIHSHVTVEMTEEKRGLAHVVTFLDEAPVAEIWLSFGVLMSKRKN